MISKRLLEQYIKDSIVGANFQRPEYNRAKVRVDFPPKNIDADYASNIILEIMSEFKKAEEKPKFSDIEDDIIRAVGYGNQAFSGNGPTPVNGFLNFLLSGQELLKNLNRINKDPENYGRSDLGEGKLAIVEYFQLNVAKLPHVGHLRSAVIGDSLKRILKFLGYEAVSDTHVGDWGTQLGIMIYAFKELQDKAKVEHSVEAFTKLYIDQNELIEKEPWRRDKGKEEFVKLERGNTENRKIWNVMTKLSKSELETYAKRLSLLPFEYYLGESFYEDKMPAILKRLEKAGLLITGETGEKYVNLEKYGLGRLICVKSDGATTYEMRDLATLAYRYDELAKKENAKLAWNLYVVDSRQAHDFRQVFKTMELLGYDVSKSRHIEFGFMSLPEGTISTRKGNVISLEALIEESKKRAMEIIKEKNSELKDKEKVAEAVGLAAIKYGDLKHNRRSDITFDWNEALSFEGNAGPYLQYTYARFCSILRKAKIDDDFRNIEYSEYFGPHRYKLLRKLYYFPDIVADTVEDFMPSVLANYLFELAEAANSFYHEFPVIQEENEMTRRFRLALVRATTIVLKKGLELLGIEAPEEM